MRARHHPIEGGRFDGTPARRRDHSRPPHPHRGAGAGDRARPCIALVGVDVDRDLLRPLRRSLASLDGDAVDVLLASHGRHHDAAYLAARELKRRFATLTVYVVRVLRRFRWDVAVDAAARIAHALVTGFASHGFVLDREELTEIAVAHRAPDEAEAPLLDEVADALLECGSRRCASAACSRPRRVPPPGWGIVSVAPSTDRPVVPITLVGGGFSSNPSCTSARTLSCRTSPAGCTSG